MTVLPRFWVSICSYKKWLAKKIWGRILVLAWLKFTMQPLTKTVPASMKILAARYLKAPDFLRFHKSWGLQQIPVSGMLCNLTLNLKVWQVNMTWLKNHVSKTGWKVETYLCWILSQWDILLLDFTSLILSPMVSRIWFRCLIFNCYTSICKKQNLIDETSK